MAANRNVSIRVPVLARVEGEGSLELDVVDGAISHVKLRIFEPPRYFEKFLEGREFREVPDAVARICGICPVAYQMSAAQALEAAFGVEIDPWAERMRRAMYCGEWLQSHALHIHLLAAPDFLGYDSAIAMAADHPEAVKRGLALQSLGNRLIRLFGGRSVHPVGVRVGGFHHAPAPAEVAAMVEQLAAMLEPARELIGWTAGLDLPEDRQDFVGVALRNDEHFAVYRGELSTSTGERLPLVDFETRFEEFHAPHSTALHCTFDQRPYLVGPLARVNLNRDQLRPQVREALAATSIDFPSANMFHSVVARAAELYHVLLEAVELLGDYRVPRSPFVEVSPRAGVGFGATEAPRGLLWHRYETDAKGRIVSARIVPPTSQNQARIEEDLRLSLEAFGLDQPDDALRLRGETVIRNYDPCISCSTHFLDLRVNR